MENEEILKNVLLSIQRALWGMIYPSIRAIAVGYEGTRKLIVICYLDREPEEKDYENLSDVTAEVCADINFSEVQENCIYSLKPFSELDHLNSWVYIRKE